MPSWISCDSVELSRRSVLNWAGISFKCRHLQSTNVRAVTILSLLSLLVDGSLHTCWKWPLVLLWERLCVALGKVSPQCHLSRAWQCPVRPPLQLSERTSSPGTFLPAPRRYAIVLWRYIEWVFNFSSSKCLPVLSVFKYQGDIYILPCVFQHILP